MLSNPSIVQPKMKVIQGCSTAELDHPLDDALLAISNAVSTLLNLAEGVTSFAQTPSKRNRYLSLAFESQNESG